MCGGSRRLQQTPMGPRGGRREEAAGVRIWEALETSEGNKAAHTGMAREARAVISSQPRAVLPSPTLADDSIGKAKRISSLGRGSHDAHSHSPCHMYQSPNWGCTWEILFAAAWARALRQVPRGFKVSDQGVAGPHCLSFVSESVTVPVSFVPPPCVP